MRHMKTSWSFRLEFLRALLICTLTWASAFTSLHLQLVWAKIRMSWLQRSKITVQVPHYAHCDVNPKNICLALADGSPSAFPVPKLLDFGLLTQSTTATLTAVTCVRSFAECFKLCIPISHSAILELHRPRHGALLSSANLDLKTTKECSTVFLPVWY